MSLTITIQPSKDKITRFTAGIFVVSVITSLVLAFLEWFMEVRTTVIYDWRWIAAYVTVLFIQLSSFLIMIFRSRARVDVKGGGIKKIAYLLAGIFGLGVVSSGAVFSGVPIILHHIAREPGELVVTVSGKEERNRRSKWRHKCQPRLIIKEFTHIGNDYFCVNQQMFNQIQAGENIKLKGMLSSFGIEPKEIFLVASK
jgi:hypothetical protein